MIDLDDEGRRESGTGRELFVTTTAVDLDFFDVFQTPVLAGRIFARQDTGVGANTVVVNRLFVDQLLAGWYGGFAVETMALGKPVASYIRESDLVHVSTAMNRDMPLLRVSPHTLEHDLESLFEQRRHWPEWGRRSRDFVMRWHHPLRIARAMAEAYRAPDSRFDLDAVPEEVASCAA